KRPSDAGRVWPPDQSPAHEDRAETSLPAATVSGAVHRSAKPRADPQRMVAKASPLQPSDTSSDVVGSRCSCSSSSIVNWPSVLARTGVQPVDAATLGNSGVAHVRPAQSCVGCATTRVQAGGTLE